MSLPELLLLAYDPGITPKDGGLPGLPVLRKVVSSVLLFAIVTAVASLAVSLAAWAWGHNTASHQAQSRGKEGALISAGAALLLGAANGIVEFASALGAQVK